MSVFTGPLVIAEIEPGLRWKLCEAIRYEAGNEGSWRWIEVPENFETDGASIPKFLRVVLAVWGTYGRAACLHDYLYSILRTERLWAGLDDIGLYHVHPAFEAMPHYRSLNDVMSARKFKKLARAWADAEFYNAMIACGTSKPLAYLMWASVRIFGGRYAR